MDQTDDHDAGAPPPPPAESGADGPSAWRLTFEYHDDEVRLVASQRVTMVAPPDDTELLERGQAGYWVELRDGEDRPLYRQMLHDPIRTHYEVFSPTPGETPTRVAAPEVKGVFQAIVPDLAGGADIVLNGAASRAALADGPARQLLKAPLHDAPPSKGRSK